MLFGPDPVLGAALTYTEFALACPLNVNVTDVELANVPNVSSDAAALVAPPPVALDTPVWSPANAVLAVESATLDVTQKASSL